MAVSFSSPSRKGRTRSRSSAAAVDEERSSTKSPGKGSIIFCSMPWMTQKKQQGRAPIDWINLGFLMEKIENNSWDPLQQVSFKWFWDGKQFNVMK